VSIKTTLLLVAALCLFAIELVAQQPLVLDSGARVRVSTSDRGKIIGRVDALTVDALVLRRDDDSTPLSLPVVSLTRVEVSRGVLSRRNSAWKKARWGALIGAVPGAVSLGLQHEQVGDGSSVAHAAALGAWSGGLFGGSIGALIGAMWPAENWERVR
jgi:hypothetical protein